MGTVGLRRAPRTACSPGHDRAARRPGPPQYGFEKADRRVSSYFYLWDEDFGPAFIKVWVNGHEGATRQATKAGMGFTELSNGFAATDDPAGLQDICDRLGPGPRCSSSGGWPACRSRCRPPTTTPATGGTVDAPSRGLAHPGVHRPPARAFFESLVADNLGLGRPDEISLNFDRQIRPTTDSRFVTRVVTRGFDVAVNVCYQHSRIKQYLKDGRALRVQTVVNSPNDLGCQRRLPHLPELQRKARDSNRRLQEAQRVGQGSVLASPAFERVALPTTTVAGKRAGAMRFGDPRVMALAGALCVLLNSVVAFTNRTLRAQVATLLGSP